MVRSGASPTNSGITLLFPLGFFALVGRYKPSTRIACLVLFVLIALFTGRSIMLLFPLWLMGALLHYAAVPTATPVARRLAVAVYLAMLLALLPLSYRFATTANYLLAVATCLLLWALLSARSPANPTSLVTRGVRLLARFSYTLYLVHTPIFYLVAVNLVHGDRWQPTPAHIAIALTTWLATIGFAFLIASATEFRTDEVRHALERRLTRTAVQPA